MLIIIIAWYLGCSLDGNHIVKFVIFKNQIGRHCQLASTVSATTFNQRLPCFFQWQIKASLLSRLGFSHQRLWRWIVVKWLLHSIIRTFISGWLLLSGIGFLDGISGEVVVQDHVVCSIQRCVWFPISECYTRALWNVSAKGLYTKSWLVDMLYPPKLPAVAL